MTALPPKSQAPPNAFADSREMAATLDEFDYLLNSGVSTNGFLRVRTQLIQTP
jgi:hypothetical protein